MPDPALQAYLASKYLSGPKADAILARVGGDEKKKKKKRKREDGSSTDASGGSGLRLVDEHEEERRRLRRAEEDGDDADGAQVVEGPKQSKFSRSAFTSIAGPSSQTLQQQQDGADKDQAEMEESADPDEAPQMVGTQADIVSFKRKQRDRERRDQASAETTSAAAPAAEPEELQFQTVYRDASGRRINIYAEEQAHKAAEEAKRKKDEERKTWGMGVKQKADQAAARERLRDEAKTEFSRHANDKRMNDTLRSIERADDPALAFLTKKRDSASSAPAKPKYKGPTPPPNRFGIAPGYRWDGVDRSTGFERMYFQKLNERKRRNASSLAYDQDDL